MPDSPPKRHPQNSDALHNHNCFLYLVQLKKALEDEIAHHCPLLSAFPVEYQADFPYGYLYSQLMSYLEDHIDTIYGQLTPTQHPPFNAFVHAIYHNDNGILAQTAPLLTLLAKQITPRHDISQDIAAELSATDGSINHTTPREQEGFFSRLGALLSANYKPQQQTNLPYVLHWSYTNDEAPIEYRFCFQAHYQDGKAMINPLFRQWLRTEAEAGPLDARQGHIYFNNLSLDRWSMDIAGKKERNASQALHTLEEDPSLQVRVFTLPSSLGLMDLNHYKKTQKQHSYTTAFAELLRAAQGERLAGVADLHLSDDSKAALFNDPSTYTNLLEKGFKDLGFNPGDQLSTAEKQAVWVHYTKYLLPDYVLNTFKPKSFNFSCKESIDRGTVASVYYNLMKSIELNQPLDEESFEIAVHGPATLVRARGMNEHRHLLWNALHTYIQANQSAIASDRQKAWLIHWRDMHCPQARVEDLLSIRIAECIARVDAMPAEQAKLKEASLALLHNMQDQTSHSRKRLLLELVSDTEALLIAPSVEAISLYLTKAQALPLESPLLYLIAGFAKALLGILLFIPSFGCSQVLISQGIATAKMGFFADKRELLSEQMQALPECFHPPP